MEMDINSKASRKHDLTFKMIWITIILTKQEDIPSNSIRGEFVV